MFQDNVFIHKSVPTSVWLFSNNINIFVIPTNSPDKNRIENMWGILVCEIYTKKKQFDSIAELKAAILEIWIQIHNSTSKNLAKSFSKRLLKMSSVKGKQTKKLLKGNVQIINMCNLDFKYARPKLFFFSTKLQLSTN